MNNKLNNKFGLIIIVSVTINYLLVHRNENMVKSKLNGVGDLPQFAILLYAGPKFKENRNRQLCVCKKFFF